MKNDHPPFPHSGMFTRYPLTPPLLSFFSMMDTTYVLLATSDEPCRPNPKIAEKDKKEEDELPSFATTAAETHSLRSLCSFVRTVLDTISNLFFSASVLLGPCNEIVLHLTQLLLKARIRSNDRSLCSDGVRCNIVRDSLRCHEESNDCSR